MIENNKTTLKKEYISVDGSFGGNQRWLRKYEDKANTLSDYGCGLISANDVLLHISDRQNNPSKEKYIAAVRDMNRRYFHVLPFLGLSGIMISFYMKLYLFMHKKHFKNKYKVRWGVAPHNLLKRIKEMLENDIPVILSIGPGLIRGRKAELPLYNINQRDNLSHNSNDRKTSNKNINRQNSNNQNSNNNNSGSQTSDITIAGSDDNYEFSRVNSVKDHYVNVTGIIESENCTMFEISSWGKKYYINYSEYRDYVKKHDNYLFSNILYIKAK